MDHSDGRDQWTTGGPTRGTVEIADLFEAVVAANRSVNTAPHRTAGARAPLPRISGLTEVAGAGSRAKAILADLDPDLLLAGVSLWVARSRYGDVGAAARADRRWSMRLSA